GADRQPARAVCPTLRGSGASRRIRLLLEQSGSEIRRTFGNSGGGGAIPKGARPAGAAAGRCRTPAPRAGAPELAGDRAAIRQGLRGAGNGTNAWPRKRAVRAAGIPVRVPPGVLCAVALS